MIKTPQSAFNKLIKDIEPSKTTKSRAKSAQSDLRKSLSKHEEFNEYYKESFLSGSYKRDTAIRPQKNGKDIDRPDIDIIVVTSHTLADSPTDVVHLLYKALNEKYTNVKKQRRSIRIETSDVDMDVVPIIQPYANIDTYYIADRELERWVETNPKKYTIWTTDVNDKAKGRFKPLVKLFKWWRRENKTVSKHPKGFILECITAESMSCSVKHYGELFVSMFKSFVEKYSWYISNNLVPTISDPGVPGNSITEGLTFSAFEGFYNKVKSHAEIGEKALNEEDEEIALNLWREVFGPRFPKFTSAKSYAELYSSIALSDSLEFPNRPVRPNKPDGFA